MVGKDLERDCPNLLEASFFVFYANTFVSLLEGRLSIVLKDNTQILCEEKKKTNKMQQLDVYY